MTLKSARLIWRFHANRLSHCVPAILLLVLAFPNLTEVVGAGLVQVWGKGLGQIGFYLNQLTCHKFKLHIITTFGFWDVKSQ